jgi:hypothetical protein
MKPEQIEALEGQRGALADHLQGLLDTPEDQRPTKTSELRAWLRELEMARLSLEQIDRMLQTAQRRASTAERTIRASAPPSGDDEAQDVVVIARIPKGPRAELRVSAKTWKGRRIIDIRCWSVRAGSSEFRPTGKGVAIAARMLPAIIDALHLAQQHA